MGVSIAKVHTDSLNPEYVILESVDMQAFLLMRQVIGHTPKYQEIIAKRGTNEFYYSTELTAKKEQ